MSERRTPPSVFRKRQAAIGVLAIAVMAMCLSAWVAPASGAVTFNPAAPVSVSSGLTHQPLTTWGTTCNYNGFLWDWYLDSTTGSVYYSTSTDGLAYSSVITPFTMANLPTTGTGLITSAYVAMMCHNNIFMAAWMDNSRGAGKWQIDFETCTLNTAGTVTCTQSNGFNSHGQLFNFATSSSVFAIRYLNGFYWVMANNQGVGRAILSSAANAVGSCVAGVCSINNDSAQNAPYDMGWTGSLYVNVGGCSAGLSSIVCSYRTSLNGISWTAFNSFASVNGGNAFVFSSSNAIGGDTAVVSSPANGGVYVFYMESHSGGNCATTNCIEATLIQAYGAIVQTTIFGSATANSPVAATTDGSGQVFAVIQQNGAYAFTTNGVTGTWTGSPYTGSGASPSSTMTVGLGDSMTSGMTGFIISTATTSSTYTVYAQLFGSFTSSASGGTGTFTLGSCPTKNTATATLANNTVYMYTTTALPGGTNINTVTTSLAATSAPAASETLYLAVYVTTFTGPVTPANPLQLTAQKSFVISAGTKNQILSWALSVPIQVATSASSTYTYGIAVLGNSKLSINDSSLSGMVTATTSGGVLPAFITGTSSTGTELYLCASATFQTIVTTTVTSTTTSTVTSGGSATTTISTTTTLTSLSSNAALGNSVGVAFVLLILLAPAFAIAIPLGVYTKSPIGAGLGFVSGLAIGALLGNQGGLIPFSVLAGMMIVIILLIVGFIFALRGSGG